MGSQRVRHCWVTNPFTLFRIVMAFIYWATTDARPCEVVSHWWKHTVKEKFRVLTLLPGKGMNAAGRNTLESLLGLSRRRGGKSEWPEVMNFLGGWVWQTTQPWFWQCASPVHRLPMWLSGEESTCQFRRCEFDPWVGKVPWRRKWQPTRVFLPGDFHGQRSLTGYSPWHHKESDMTEWLNNN